MAFRYVLFNLLIALFTTFSVGAHQPIPDAALHTIPNLVVSCSSDSDCAPDEYCNKVCRSFTGCAVVCVTKKSIPIQQMFETAIFKRFYLTHHVVPVGVAEPHWLKNEMAVMEALNNELAASEDEKDGSSATQQLEDDSLLPVVSELKKPLSITHVKVSESAVSSARADHVIDAHTSKDEDIEASGLDLETDSGEVISVATKAEESSAVEAHTEANMEEASGNDPEDITADTVPSTVSMEKLITDVDDNNNESEASKYVLKEDVNEISNVEQSTTEASGIDTDSSEYETAEASGEYLSEGVRDQSRLGGMKKEANEPLNGQNSVVTSTDVNGDSDLEGSGYGQNKLSVNEQSYARNEEAELDSNIESAEASGDELDGSDQIGKPEFKIDTEEGSGGHGLVVVDHSVGAKMAVETEEASGDELDGSDQIGKLEFKIDTEEGSGGHGLVVVDHSVGAKVAVETKEASGHDFSGSDTLQVKPAMKVDVDDEVLDEGFITLPKNVPEIKKTGMRTFEYRAEVEGGVS
ncbi:unnamed protein product [Anisakis simplex]|uniref:WAP domain-containing protein n=1 Tax=Anisakis simplex TaxID=6269 RepID=A0A0M3IYE7_ANISI|nr:unnamed protein product [Anisakis simplex]